MPVYNLQPTYNRFMPAYTVGMIDDQADNNIVTRNCEPAGGIGFGLAVGQGADDRGGILGGSNFVGISVRDPTLPRLEGSAIDVYLQNENMNVLTRGPIAVLVRETVVAGDPVYYDTTNGQIYHAAGGGRLQVAGGRFRTSAVGTVGSPAIALLTLGIQI